MNEIDGFTTEEAAREVGVTPRRIRQLARGTDAIDHRYILGRLIISPQGIVDAKSRNKTLGRPRKAVAA